jgi:hypothetical protein
MGTTSHTSQTPKAKQYTTAASKHVPAFAQAYETLCTAFGRAPNASELARKAAHLTGLSTKTATLYLAAIKNEIGPLYTKPLPRKGINVRPELSIATSPAKTTHKMTLDDLLALERAQEDAFTGTLSQEKDLDEATRRYFENTRPSQRSPSPLVHAFIGDVLRTDGTKPLAEYCAHADLSLGAGQDILTYANLTLRE